MLPTGERSRKTLRTRNQVRLA